jgi:DNA-binding MarR family transcriptional regulator
MTASSNPNTDAVPNRTDEGEAVRSPEGFVPYRSPCDSPQVVALEAFYQASNYRTEESIGYLMRRIVALLAQDVDRSMEPQGLTNAQWVPLLKLYMGHARTVAELARVCELDAGAMTRLLDRMEAKGLCRRIRSSEDRRVVNLELTEEGRQAAAGIPSLLCRAQNALLQGFSQEEWQTLKSLLARMLNNAQAPQGAGKKP